MTRQSKALQKAKLAEQITKLHLSGQRGPAKTTPKHTKLAKNRHYTNLTRGTKDMANSKKRQDGIGGA